MKPFYWKTTVSNGISQTYLIPAERSINDALHVVADAIKDGKVVPGGGAIEEEIAKVLREYATEIGGRQQLAIEAFANAIEVIPRTLAENAGLDPIEIIAELRSVHKEKKDGWKYGVDVFEGKVVNMVEKGVLEPISVKIQAIKSALEAATLILRIDDIIAAARAEEEKKEKEEKKEEEE